MKDRSGFTLIELLVVIAIISVLSVMGFTAFGGLTGSANDSRRKSDVAAIAKAYEVKFSSGEYSTLSGDQFGSGIIPTPPEGGQYFNELSLGNTGFRVCAALDGGAQCSTSSPTCYCMESTQGQYAPSASPTPTPTPAPTPTPTPPASNIAFRSSSTANTVGTGSVSSLLINKPAGVVDGDLLIAQVTIFSNTITVTSPAGWAAIRNDAHSLIGIRSYLFWKRASGEGTNYTFNTSAITRINIGILAYSNVTTTNPFWVVSDRTFSVSNTNTITAPSGNTTVSNELLIFFASVRINVVDIPPPTTPFTMTERYGNSWSGNMAIEAADFEKVSPGAFGVISTTYTGTAVHNIGQVISVKPL